MNLNNATLLMLFIIFLYGLGTTTRIDRAYFFNQLMEYCLHGKFNIHLIRLLNLQKYIKWFQIERISNST